MAYYEHNGYTVKTNDYAKTSAILKGESHFIVKDANLGGVVPEDATYDEALKVFAKACLENNLTGEGASNLFPGVSITGLTPTSFMVRDGLNSKVCSFNNPEQAIEGMTQSIKGSFIERGARAVADGSVIASVDFEGSKAEKILFCHEPTMEKEASKPYSVAYVNSDGVEVKTSVNGNYVDAYNKYMAAIEGGDITSAEQMFERITKEMEKAKTEVEAEGGIGK